MDFPYYACDTLLNFAKSQMLQNYDFLAWHHLPLLVKFNEKHWSRPCSLINLLTKITTVLAAVLYALRHSCFFFFVEISRKETNSVPCPGDSCTLDHMGL